MTSRISAFCCTLVVLLVGLTGLLLSSAALIAQDNPEPDYVNRPPSQCSNCHIDVYYTWWESGHAQTVASAQFQEVWDRARNNPDCMTCHSPNMTPETGMGFDGVGCGACHFTIDPTRRRADRYTYHGTMGTRSDPEDCATCHGADHALTYIEWETSAHNGPRTVDCASCHLPHSGGLTQASGQALCGSCHLQEVPTTNPHMHVEGGCADCHPTPVNTDNVHMHEAEAGVDCITCHVVTEYDEYGRYLQWSGHTMQVTLTSCLNCHGIHEPLESDED